MSRLLFLACALLACGVPAVGAEQEIRMTAERTKPQEIRVAWRDADRRAAGHVVEFASSADGEYVILAYCPPHVSEFVHPRLAPSTTFYYRVRAFNGPASGTVDVSLPKDLSDADYAARYAKPEDYKWAAPRKRATNGAAGAAATASQRSLRKAASARDGAPADLHAELAPNTVSGFLLTWADRASDEDGMLLEKVVDDRDFLVCAFVEPDVNSFGWAFEPPTREGKFRVRAIYYGKPSNVVSETTQAAAEDAAPSGTGERAGAHRK